MTQPADRLSLEQPIAAIQQQASIDVSGWHMRGSVLWLMPSLGKLAADVEFDGLGYSA